MTSQEVLAFFARRADAWSRRDEWALAATHSESGVVLSPMFARVVGRDAIAATYRSLFDSFPDWQMTFDPPLVDGDRVAWFFTTRATHQGTFMGIAGTGRRFEIQGVLYCRMADGLVAEERRVYDFTGLLIKVGVLRSKPAA
jgi:steroid delta-isomerase-like uncharacterized protein